MGKKFVSFEKHKRYLANILDAQPALVEAAERDSKLLPKAATEALLEQPFARLDNLHSQQSSTLSKRLEYIGNANIADGEKAAVDIYKSSLTKLIASRKRQEAVVAGIEKYHPNERFDAYKFCNQGGFKELIDNQGGVKDFIDNIVHRLNAEIPHAEKPSWLTRALGKNAGLKAAGIGAIAAIGGGWAIHELSQRDSNKGNSAAR